MAVPAIVKIVVNMGIGEGTQDVKMLEKAVEELGNITGQKPIIRRAKKPLPISRSGRAKRWELRLL